MVQQIININSLLRSGKEAAVTQLRQYSPADSRKFLNASLGHIAHAIGSTKSEDIATIDILTQLVIAHPDLFELKDSCIILVECSFFYEQLGNFKEGVRIGLIAFGLAIKHGDINLQRRANNVLGALSMRICDFQGACHYFEKALRLSRRLDNPLYECSVLGNVAGLFHAMGLTRDATRVYLRCLSYTGNTAQSRVMQAYNAVNALKISPLTCDAAAVEYSYKIACKYIKLKQFAENSLLLAYFELGRSRYLIDRNQQDLADQHIKKAMAQHGRSNNPRVAALLKTAKALCLFASGREEGVRQSKHLLKQLLVTTKNLPTHHEDVLRALIQVYSTEKTLYGARVSLKFAQQLRQYVLEEKQTRFAFQLSNGFAICGAAEVEDGASLGGLACGQDGDGTLGEEVELRAVYEGLARARRSLMEERFRTGAYSVAENWALAAELSDDGSGGRHCFRVGKLAKTLAFAIGMRPENCIELELACRLHDIGKIAVDEKTLPGLRTHEGWAFGAVIEHTVAGARLLDCSTDPILMMAAVVAKHHHEWWNGCGYPDGLRGDAIPVEARICAIADTYESFTSPVSGCMGWTHKEAVQQICAMGGVQLDPGLISPFLEVVASHAAKRDRVTEEVNRSMERNQLARAKKKLFETLELMD